MGIKSLFKGTLGYLGKRVANTLDSTTGGLSTHIGKKVLDFAHKNAGVIGKTVGNIGRSVLSDKTRDTLSKVTDSAMKFIPEGKIKDTISNISKSAQKGSSVVNLGKSSNSNPKSPNSTIVPGPTTFGQNTKPRIRSKAADIF